MSYGPLVEIPEGYCFIPSCDPTPTSASTRARPISPSTPSVTVDTTTLITTPTHSKRSVSAPSVVPMLGSHSLQAFPTDLPVQIGSGPVCIVHCNWARMQNGKSSDGVDVPPRHSSRPKAPLRPISDMVVTTTRTTMGSVHQPATSASSTSATMTGPPSPPMPTMSATPSANSTHEHKRSVGLVVGFVVSGLVGLALMLGVAWLITRQIRRIRARLNPHSQGVHRDRELQNDFGIEIPLGDEQKK